MAENIDIRELNMRIEQQSSFVTNLVTGMDRVIVGQKHLVDSLLIGLLSDGNILLEGVPGLAKTLAMKTLSLPEHIVPVSIIAVGYPALPVEPKDKWNPQNVSYQ
jgi:hypothetical protein